MPDTEDKLFEQLIDTTSINNIKLRDYINRKYVKKEQVYMDVQDYIRRSYVSGIDTEAYRDGLRKALDFV